jgi:pimeloyl-ACP methyl ester carboxylesterase
VAGVSDVVLGEVGEDVDAGGIRTNVLQAGEGAPVVLETLIVHGRDDQVIPLKNSERLHALIERSELHVFGRCGHWTQIEWAAEFNQLLVQFLERPHRQG